MLGRPTARFLVALALVTPLLAGCLGSSSDAPTPQSTEAAQVAAGPQAVVAFIDTGINPYHATFRDGSALSGQHPSTYIPGYPADAEPLNLTLDAPDWKSAVKSDCESVWAKVEVGKLYWIPGTKIVGAIATEEQGDVDCTAEDIGYPPILDRGAHGTMVASRGASVEYGACHECRIVAVQGFNDASVQWAADNAHWIDVQSNSWGPFLPVFTPVSDGPVDPGVFTNDARFIETVESAAQVHLAFWASGNGALTRFGAVGHPTIIDPRMTPSIVMVGGHDSGYVNTWPDFPPHVVSDSCNSWAAYHEEMSKSADNVGGGTSGATPYVAGAAAKILLEARRLVGDLETGIDNGTYVRGTNASITAGPLSDGTLTIQEMKTLLFKTATARPERQHEDGSVCDAVSGLVIYGSTPIAWKDVPDAYPEFVHIGYGAVDNASMPLTVQVLTGSAEMPGRSRTDAYFALDMQARQAYHGTLRSLGQL